MTRMTAQDVLALQQSKVPGGDKGWTTGDRKVLEADVQRAVVQLLKRHPAIAWVQRMNSRVVDVVDKKSKTGMRPMFMTFKGCPDVWAMLKGSGRLVVIECKSSTGRLTDEQAAFLSLVNQFGGLAFVARSADDVLKHLPLKDS